MPANPQAAYLCDHDIPYPSWLAKRSSEFNKSMLPKLNLKSRVPGVTMKFAMLVLLIVCALVPGSLAKDKKNGPDPIGKSDPAKGVNFYSIEKEIALGKELAEDTERQANLLSDSVITEYVNRLGQNLVRNSDAKVPFTIKVIQSEQINGFAFPGGYMFVNTGLILRAENEAELAGVMAHEIAHVAARHGTKQATRGTIMNYATIPLVFMGGWASYAIREAAALAIPLGFLQFSRAMEREADHLGMAYMYKAGYDPNAFVDFFEKIQSLEKKKPGTVSRIFSTHPMTGSRITRAQQEIQNELRPLAEYVVDTSEFQQVRQRLAVLENRRKVESQHESIPVLKRTSSGRIDPDETSESEEDKRPTLKRRD